MKNNWKTKKLEDVVQVLDSKRVPINNAERERRINGRSEDSLYPYYGATGQVGSIDDFIFNGEYVLLGEDGAPFLDSNKSKAYIVKGKFWVNNHAHVLNGIEVNNTFLKYYLDQFDYRDFVTGTTRLKLNQTRMKAIPVPTPNINTQESIAQKLDSLFSKIDAGEEGLQQVQQQLEVYRQAVLKGVFDGTFSKSLINQDTLKPPISKELYGSNEVPYTLPENWRWVKFVDIGELGRGKSKHRPRNDKRLFGGKYPFIQTGDVRKARKWLSSYTQTYSDFGLQQSKLWPAGTLMITIAANIAETAILEIEACFPDSVVGFIPNQELCNVEYTEFFIRTIKDRLETFAPATAQKNINLRILNDVYIPLPPLEEQKIIVDAVNKLMSISYVVDETISKSKTMSQSLRQSILKKAFNGKLIH